VTTFLGKPDRRTVRRGEYSKPAARRATGFAGRLETGTVPAFAPARALYASAGFRPCGPFGDYQPMDTSTFMTLELAAGG
jgi:hypothetical protein